jgi:insulysin
MSSVNILKSQNDRREYRYVKLANDLDVLLVSDPKTQKASSALSVQIGSNYDHKSNVQGIAHFLEHMLFMGSEKYPDESEYSNLVSKYNGYSNAYTADDHTCYYFETVPEGLFQVLDVFVQFFIKPLLKEDSVNRELNAVDSEYTNSLTSEPWRFGAVQKQCVKNDHPWGHFNCGNVETLKVPNIRNIVNDFYNSYYSSHLMKLVVVGSESLDILEENVQKMFSHVPKREINLLSDLGTIYNKPIYSEVVPMKDEKRLDLMWEYELSTEYNKYNLDKFLSHIIGYEGKGSLFTYLQKKFYAKSLSAGSGGFLGVHNTFKISINLTDEGFENVKLVTKLVEEYINMLKTKTYDEYLRVYNEYKLLHEIKFKNLTIGDPTDFAQNVSSSWAVKDLKPEDLVSHEYIFNDYNTDAHKYLQTIVESMNYDNSLCFVRSKTYDDKTTHEEKWYKVKYNMTNTLPSLESIRIMEDVTKFTLPSDNIYLCVDPKISTNVNNPILLNLKKSDIWWKYDNTYSVPDINLSVRFRFKNINNNVKNSVTMTLLMKCIKHLINDELYDINTANYTANFVHSLDTVYLDVGGYPENFYKVLSFLTESLKKVRMDDIKTFNETLENIKRNTKQDLENYKYNPPFKVTTDKLCSEILNEYYSASERLSVIDSITFEDVMQFHASLFVKDNVRAYGLIQGNVLYEKAMTYGKCIDDLLINKVCNTYENKFKNELTTEFTAKVENPDESNSCFSLFVKMEHQAPNFFEKQCYLDVLGGIIHEQYFDQLRTKEQLGYAVHAFVTNIGNVENPFCTFQFRVQSPEKNIQYLKERTFKFVAEFTSYLEAMVSETMDEFVTSQIQQLEKPFQNLNDESSHNIVVIEKHNCLFELNQEKAKFMKTLKKENILEFYKKQFDLTQSDKYWCVGIEGNKAVKLEV